MPKKDFSGTNATVDFFISQEAKEKVDGKDAPKQKRPRNGGDKARKGAEIRSRRVQVVVTPTIYASILKIAKKKYLSVNEVINQALEEHIKRSK